MYVYICIQSTLRAADYRNVWRGKSRDKNQHNVIVLIAQRERERKRGLNAFTR